jgi:hypothetical protein
VFEICRGLSILDHDKVVVFVLEAGRGEVSRARAQKPAINMVALEMQSENRFSCSASTALISGSGSLTGVFCLRFRGDQGSLLCLCRCLRRQDQRDHVNRLRGRRAAALALLTA